MKKTIYLFSISFVLALSGCTAALVGGAAAGGYLIGKDDRSAKVVAGDASISTAIKTKLLANRYINGFKIDVDTYDSVVTMTGTVNSNFSKEHALNVANKTRGVAKVIDKISVDSTVQPTPQQ